MSIDGPAFTAPFSLARGENAQVQIHKNLNGGCTIFIKDAAHPAGMNVRLSPDSTMGLAVEMLEAVGIPIKAAMGERLKQHMRGLP